MMGVIAFFAGLVFIGTVVDVTLNILHLDDVFSESFVQKFQGFSLYTNTIKLFQYYLIFHNNSIELIVDHFFINYNTIQFFINYIIMICTIKLITTTTIKYSIIIFTSCVKININTIIATNPRIIIICAIDIMRTTCMVNV